MLMVGSNEWYVNANIQGFVLIDAPIGVWICGDYYYARDLKRTGVLSLDPIILLTSTSDLVRW
jgi:hypothetical protein